jgi:hypothetical protein
LDCSFVCVDDVAEPKKTVGDNPNETVGEESVADTLLDADEVDPNETVGEETGECIAADTRCNTTGPSVERRHAAVTEVDAHHASAFEGISHTDCPSNTPPAKALLPILEMLAGQPPYAVIVTSVTMGFARITLWKLWRQRRQNSLRLQFMLFLPLSIGSLVAAFCFCVGVIQS